MSYPHSQNLYRLSNTTKEIYRCIQILEIWDRQIYCPSGLSLTMWVFINIKPFSVFLLSQNQIAVRELGPPLIILKMESDAIIQEAQVVSRSWKRQEKRFPSNSIWKEMQSRQHPVAWLGFSPMRPTSDFLPVEP